MNSDFTKIKANKIMLPYDAVIVSDNASDSETVGLKYLRYNKGGGWCTAFVNSQSGSGIEFYDNGNVRILRYGQIWEPGS